MNGQRYLIVGLGNPGQRYRNNRHNVGFQCLDRLARLHRLEFDKRQKKGKLALGQIEGCSVILLKPQTFMNESGQSVAPVAQFYQVPPERTLVILDDLDLPQGTVRLRAFGGSGGHGGMRSIIRQLGTQQFARVRIGIGRPPGRMDPADYVLQDFRPQEQELVTEICNWVAQAIQCWLDEGIEIAMTQYNRDLLERTE
jgi:PTH1 family peptidyl-tRNA hydrolase